MKSTSPPGPGDRAILVSAQLPGVSDAELQSSLDELQRLAKTLGLRTIARISQVRPHTKAPTVLGAGKLTELARWTGGDGIVPAGAITSPGIHMLGLKEPLSRIALILPEAR